MIKILISSDMTQTKVGKLINNLNIKLNENIKYNVLCKRKYQRIFKICLDGFCAFNFQLTVPLVQELNT